MRAAFHWAPTLLPLKVVERGEKVTLYEHPRPVFGSRHLLIVPSRGVKDLFALTDPRHADIRAEMWRLREWAASELGLAHAMINAGPRQDVLQVHMHVTDGDLPTGDLVFESFEAAVCGLTAVPDITRRVASGLSVVKPTGSSVVHISSDHLSRPRGQTPLA